MGVEIPGERLGLGTNLFSKDPTLTEKYGKKEEKKELEKRSDFMIRLGGIDKDSAFKQKEEKELKKKKEKEKKHEEEKKKENKRAWQCGYFRITMLFPYSQDILFLSYSSCIHFLLHTSSDPLFGLPGRW